MAHLSGSHWAEPALVPLLDWLANGLSDPGLPESFRFRRQESGGLGVPRGFSLPPSCEGGACAGSPSYGLTGHSGCLIRVACASWQARLGGGKGFPRVSPSPFFAFTLGPPYAVSSNQLSTSRERRSARSCASTPARGGGQN